MSSKVRVRIAPSPTGNLHVGTARTALYNYLFARHNQGDFILRLEDTDEVRSDEAYTKDILDGLKWLGLSWDEGPDIGGPYPPYRQTEKIQHYLDVARKLIADGHAYECYCTTEELDALKEEQKNAKAAQRYDNRCRNLSGEQAAEYKRQGRTAAIRFKIKEPHTVSWDDLIKGNIAIDTADLGGDMVIVKSNGIAIYNFAVVVDDVDMKMTHVIRGEDHIHNTAKQILIYEALGYPTPQFAHAPLIFDMDRAKLSKRKHGEMVHVDKYKNDGYMPEAIVNYLAQMSWTHPEAKEVFSLEEAASKFTLDKMSKSPAVFDVDRLNWFNSQYIKSLPLDVVAQRAMPFLANYDLKQYDTEHLHQIIALVRESLTKLNEITEATKFFFVKQVEIPVDLNETLVCTEQSKLVLSTVLQHINEFPWGDPKGCKAVVDKIGKDKGLKGKDLYWPVRAALQGKTSGPDLGATLSILGQARVKARIEGALGLCPQT